MIQQLQELFKRQARAWPQLARGIEGLARAQTRTVRIDWFDILIRHIPHRVGSTTAPVDRDSVARRPCFLCAGNLPPEEEGVQFEADFTIYCNPFPIVDHHLTIAHKQHGLQRIANQFGTMLDLAAALPGYFVIYNGPECGASAPDHMHFQAGSRAIASDREGHRRADRTYRPELRKKCVPVSWTGAICFDRANGSDHRSARGNDWQTKRNPWSTSRSFMRRGEWVSVSVPARKTSAAGVSYGRTDGESGID